MSRLQLPDQRRLSWLDRPVQTPRSRHRRRTRKPKTPVPTKVQSPTRSKLRRRFMADPGKPDRMVQTCLRPVVASKPYRLPRRRQTPRRLHPLHPDPIAPPITKRGNPARMRPRQKLGQRAGKPLLCPPAGTTPI